MAALVAGVKYGLSSQDINYENKSLIFVKLTDSAVRAIEEYLKNGKSSLSPSIQFLGNEGHLTIPSVELPGGQARFNFSLSSNEDIEGPQGSFECLQTTGPKSLAALGALTTKMRIHAKDDVYEATRHRVAAAEEMQKKNCTRVIKQSELNKSKTKRWSKWEEHRNERIAAATAAQNGPGGRREYSRTKPSTGTPTVLFPAKASSPVNGYQRTSLHTKPQGNNHAQKPGNPDVAKRPLKERLLHLLALRPFKKPELMDRVSRDGLKEKDRHNFWLTVNSVATFKMNVYQLKREMWADVQEDWPFYSEQDKAALKRRKPQNLTPPGNSDGGSSASSGQSPTSTHPGSPPSMIMSGISNKRPGYYESADGFQTKKQRISHYSKPSDPPQTISTSLFNSCLPSLDMDTDVPARSANSSIRTERQEQRIDRVPRPDSSDWTERPDRTDRNDWNDDWADRSDRIDRTSRPERLERRSDRTDRQDRLDRHDRPLDRTDRPERPIERSDRFDRQERNDRDRSARDRRGFDISSDQENIQVQFKSENGALKRNSDSSVKEKNSKSETVHMDAALRLSVGKVNSLSGSDNRDRMNSPAEKDRLSAFGVPKDRLSPLPRPRNLIRDGFNNSDSSQGDSRTNFKSSSNSDARTSVALRRSGEEARDNRDNQDRTLSQMSSSRTRGGHHDITEKYQSSSNARVNSEQQCSNYSQADFLGQYTTIKDVEQRRRYKADFNKDYREYQDLHQKVENVSQHFAELEKRLRQEQEGSEGYKKIKDQIVQDYMANKKDEKLDETKKRFQYLHEKLSHIKRLVQEYDTSQKQISDS